MYSNVAMMAAQVAERDAQKRAAERVQYEKEMVAQRYNEKMQQLSQDAVNEAKKSNEIAKENKVLAEKSVKIASESKLLSLVAILVALAAIGVSVVLHFC
jgi:ATP/ADP translocase